jgi:hypothetical protein
LNNESGDSESSFLNPKNFTGQLSDQLFHNYSAWLYVAAGFLYLVGVWEHVPFAGGHIYSDIITVFQERFLMFCPTSPCTLGTPYINNFVEYPVLVGFFMWAMGSLAYYIPISLPPSQLSDYYTYTALFLFIPTLLLIRETVKVAEIIGVGQKHKRTFLFLVATPSFIFMLLLNWYVIGTFFAIYGLRKFLEGSRLWSGILLGISALSNLITVVPALGMLFGANNWKERIKFLSGIGIVLVVVYIPLLIANSFPHSYINSPPLGATSIERFGFVPLNTNIITNFLSYQQNWYIEGSWMLAFIGNLSPLRHDIFPILFVALSAAILYRGFQLKRNVVTASDRAKLIVHMSWLFTFAFLFSTYVCTPQMNIVILPFFVLMPIASYPEFFAFDVVNSLVIVWGFSSPLLFLGLYFHVPSSWQFQLPGAPIWDAPNQLFAVIRSFWIGKFLIFDGLIFPRGPFATKRPAMPPIAPTMRVAKLATEPGTHKASMQ